MRPGGESFPRTRRLRIDYRSNLWAVRADAGPWRHTPHTPSSSSSGSTWWLLPRNEFFFFFSFLFFALALSLSLFHLALALWAMVL